MTTINRKEYHPYPDKIRITNLPLWWHGWNTTLYQSDEKGEDDTPIYRLNPYFLYSIIPIIGITISRKNGKWIMMSDNELFPIIQKESSFSDNELFEVQTSYFFNNSGPVGKWSYDSKIYPHPY